MLESAGIVVKVASNQLGTAHSYPSKNHEKTCDDTHCKRIAVEYPDYAQAHVDIVIDEVNPHDYDGIFFVGGPGALEFLDNKKVYSIIQTMHELQRPLGAICISPRILAHAGVLTNKKATCWNGDGKVDALFKKYGVQCSFDHVVVDGTSITADGPQAAEEFGKAIVALVSQKVKNSMVVVKKEECVQYTHSPYCFINAYPLGDKDISIVIAEVNGRYPESGWVVNEKCKEIGFVLKGSGTLTTEKQAVVLFEGDAVLINAGEKYFLQGNMMLLLPTAPAWYGAQHKQSEK